MKSKVLSFVVCLLVSTVAAQTAAAGEANYKFKVHNDTKVKIVKLLVSEDGKEWGAFDIGDGIKGAEDATLAWAEHTNDGNCEQQVKAVYADESASEVQTFDFCEKDLTINFTE